MRKQEKPTGHKTWDEWKYYFRKL